MGFFHTEDYEPRPAKHASVQLRPQSREQVIEQKCLREPRLVLKRQQIAGAQRLRRALEKIELLQRELREAGDGLRSVLSWVPLAKAYAQFQDEGGVTACEWNEWLDGEILCGRGRHRGKGHLRLVADNESSRQSHDELEAV